MPHTNLLLLKYLLGLLLNISENSATSRMTASSLAICVGSNLLSPAEEHMLPLEVLMQVNGKIRCIYQLAMAFQAHLSFAVQRYLAASFLEQMLMG